MTDMPLVPSQKRVTNHPLGLTRLTTHDKPRQTHLAAADYFRQCLHLLAPTATGISRVIEFHDPELAGVFGFEELYPA